jgi:hypothetical protein
LPLVSAADRQQTHFCWLMQGLSGCYCWAMLGKWGHEALEHWKLRTEQTGSNTRLGAGGLLGRSSLVVACCQLHRWPWPCHAAACPATVTVNLVNEFWLWRLASRHLVSFGSSCAPLHGIHSYCQLARLCCNVNLFTCWPTRATQAGHTRHSTRGWAEEWLDMAAGCC